MCTTVIANCLPKSGTNLLAALLDQLNYSQSNGSAASNLLHDKRGALGRLTGRTFQRGKIGSWKQQFTEQHLAPYQALAGHNTREWGYGV